MQENSDLSQKRVAIQGYEGSFHHIVAERYFNRQPVTIIPCPTFKCVAEKVESGNADYGVMAIENSIVGSILPNYNILQNDNLQVYGEAYLRISQNLMALPGVGIEEIEEVHSHYMALHQCDQYLDGKGWKLVESEDTALSAKHIMEGRIGNRATIASELAAELYGLEIIAPDIHTIKTNYTRFMILERSDKKPDENANKVSLYFTTENKPGALLNALQKVEDSGLNLTKLQSYPIPSQPWHYLFHLDMEFGDLRTYETVVEGLRTVTNDLHIYGVYKKGIQL